MVFSVARSLHCGRRSALLLGCSLIALSFVAANKVAAQQVTSGYTYSTPFTSTVTNSSGPSSSINLTPSTIDAAGYSVFGHDYGSVNGDFGTRSSGQGLYAISGFTDYTSTFTNTSTAASDYTLTYVLDNGQVGINAANGTGFAYTAQATAVLTASYSSAPTATLLNYGVSLNFSGAPNTQPTFSESGLVLNPAGPTLSTIGGDYSWTTFTGSVDLGVLAPGASAVVDYRLSSYAAGSSPPAALAQLNAVVTTGGYGGNTDGSIARFGDPFSGTGSPLPFVIVASEVPEPASLAVLGAGLAGLALVRRRRSAM